MTDPILSLKDVTIRTAEQNVFSGINIVVRRGEHWAFTGENEGLKTALLEAIAGKAAVIKGKMQYSFLDVNGNKHNDIKPTLSSQKLVQLVSSRHSFRSLSGTADFYYQQRFNSSDSENSATVWEYMASRNTGNSNRVWTFEKVVHALKLQPLLHEKLIKLSNGETKRVLLAAALLCNPALLLLHNPLAGLDVASRQEITGLLNEVAQGGTTLIIAAPAQHIPEFITHVAVCTKEKTLTTF